MRKFYTILLSMLFILAMNCTVFASEFLPPDMSPPSYDSYVIFQYNDTLTQCVVYNSDDWTPYVEKSGNDYVLSWIKHRETAYVRYFSVIENYDSNQQNNGWYILNQYDFLSEGFTGTILKSNKDIYDSNDMLFFQGLPLQEVIQNNLQNRLQPKVAGEMRILTLCGVGLIALLVGLKVFGKVFAIFRVQ